MSMCNFTPNKAHKNIYIKKKISSDEFILLITHLHRLGQKSSGLRKIIAG